MYTVDCESIEALAILLRCAPPFQLVDCIPASDCRRLTRGRGCTPIHLLLSSVRSLWEVCGRVPTSPTPPTMRYATSCHLIIPLAPDPHSLLAIISFKSSLMGLFLLCTSTVNLPTVSYLDTCKSPLLRKVQREVIAEACACAALCGL